MYDFLVGIMHVPFHINGFHMIMFSYVKEHTRCNQQKKQEYSGRNQAASRAPGPEGLQPLSSSATAAVRISHNHPQLAASGCGGRHPADASYRSRAAGVFFAFGLRGGISGPGLFRFGQDSFGASTSGRACLGRARFGRVGFGRASFGRAPFGYPAFARSAFGRTGARNRFLLGRSGSRLFPAACFMILNGFFLLFFHFIRLHLQFLPLCIRLALSLFKASRKGFRNCRSLISLPLPLSPAVDIRSQLS